MSAHIALLRAINVGGNNKIAMADLRTMFGDLGFANVRTLLQSGNVVFESPDSPDAALERMLEEETDKRLGVRVDYIVRSDEEWRAAVAANPYPDAAHHDPAHLLLMCLKAAPSPESVTSLREAIVGAETVEVIGRDAYLVYPQGVGTSKLTNAVIERKLAVRGTARNWNTVLKLEALTSP